MISNAGDFSELQLVAPDLQREPNEGLCGTKNVFEKLTVLYLSWHKFWFLYQGGFVAQQVPSGFYLTDAMLALDKVMMGCLLVPEAGSTKKDAAAQESKRLKRLLGALRHLFRNCYLAFWFLKGGWVQAPAV